MRPYVHKDSRTTSVRIVDGTNSKQKLTCFMRRNWAHIYKQCSFQEKHSGCPWIGHRCDWKHRDLWTLKRTDSSFFKGKIYLELPDHGFLKIKHVAWWTEYFGGDKYPWSLELVGKKQNDFAFYLKGLKNEYLSVDSNGDYKTTSTPTTKFKLESPDQSFKTCAADAKPPSAFPDRQYLQRAIEAKIASEKDSISWP